MWTRDTPNETLRQHLLRVAEEIARATPEPQPSHWIRRVLAAPDSRDGLPLFMPYLDDRGREVWGERSQFSEEQWNRALQYVAQRVRAELS